MKPEQEGGTPPTLNPTSILESWNVDLVSPVIILGVVLVGVGFTVWLWVQMRANHGAAVEAGLNYVVGPMGSGKSMFGTRRIVQSLCRGQYVVTNVELLPGWAERVARKQFPRDRSEQKRAARVRWLEGYYLYTTSLRQAMRFRPPCAYCGGSTEVRGTGQAPDSDPAICNHSGPENEGRAAFVWDETHNDLNNRDYQGHGADREQREAEKAFRRLILRWATQLRKLGYSGFLLSQHHENTDAQLRRVCNHIIRLQNQRFRGIGVLLPKRLTLFLVFWYPANLGDGSQRVVASRFDRYFLPWERDLYDSWATYHGIDAEDLEEGLEPPIYLPAGGYRSLGAGGPREAGGAPELVAPSAAPAVVHPLTSVPHNVQRAPGQALPATHDAIPARRGLPTS